MSQGDLERAERAGNFGISGAKCTHKSTAGAVLPRPCRDEHDGFESMDEYFVHMQQVLYIVHIAHASTTVLNSMLYKMLIPSQNKSIIH